MSKQGDLVFVTYTSAPKSQSRDPTVQHTVRKQAVNAYLSPQGSDLSRERQRQSDAVTSQPQRKHMNRFRLPKKQRERSPVSEPQTTREDASPPLARLPALDPVVSSLGPHAWEILEYCQFSYRMKTMSFQDEHDWFKFASHNSSISHASLCLVSLNRDLDRGSRASKVTLAHRAATIRALREEMEHRSLSDGEITSATIAILALAEDLERNKANSNIHMQGMRKLVGERGGLLSFSGSQALLKVISWAEIYHSSTWLVASHMTNLLSFPSVEAVVNAGPASHLTAQTEDFRSDLAIALCPHLRTFIDLVRSFPEHIDLRSFDFVETERRNRSVYITEQMVINLRKQVPLEGETTALSRAFVIGCHIYVNLVLAWSPRQSTVIQGLVDDMVEEIRKYDIAYLADHSKRTWNVCTFWVQAMAIATVAEEFDRSALMQSFKRTVHGLGIRSLEDLKRTLRLFFWADELNLEDRLLDFGHSAH